MLLHCDIHQAKPVEAEELARCDCQPRRTAGAGQARLAG
jgi:hypothetical protein